MPHYTAAMPRPQEANDDLPSPVVPAETYDDHYFRDVCLGHEEWSASAGSDAHAMYGAVLKRAAFRQGERVLDIGTGRGELPAVAVRDGASCAIGIEYAHAGAALARQTLTETGTFPRAAIVMADARAIPLTSATIDLVTMVDVVEHLTPDELHRTLCEARRVLRPGGRILIHTMPSRTVYEVTYRLQRLLRPGRRRRWPADPRNGWERAMHVNEQSVTALRRALRRAGFDPARAELGRWVYTDFVPEERAKRLYALLAKIPYLDRLAVGDMWAEGRRPDDGRTERSAAA